MPRLTFDGVGFRYRMRSPMVIDGFSWPLPGGRTVLLGPNGAGKTTLLRLGATSLAPTRGRVRMGDLDATRRRDRAKYRALLGWMPQEIRPIAGLRCQEQVAYIGWLKGLSRSEAWREAGNALERVDLTDEAARRSSELSGGLVGWRPMPSVAWPDELAVRPSARGESLSIGIVLAVFAIVAASPWSLLRSPAQRVT